MTDSWQLQKKRIGRTDYIGADRIAARHLDVVDEEVGHILARDISCAVIQGIQPVSTLENNNVIADVSTCLVVKADAIDVNSVDWSQGEPDGHQGVNTKFKAAFQHGRAVIGYDGSGTAFFGSDINEKRAAMYTRDLNSGLTDPIPFERAIVVTNGSGIYGGNTVVGGKSSYTSEHNNTSYPAKLSVVGRQIIIDPSYADTYDPTMSWDPSMGRPYTLFVDGSTRMTGDIIVDGSFIGVDTLGVSGEIAAEGSLFILGTSYTAGGGAVQNDLGNTFDPHAFYQSYPTTRHGQLFVFNDSTFWSGADVCGNLRVGLGPYGDSALANAPTLDVSGTLKVSGNTTLDGHLTVGTQNLTVTPEEFLFYTDVTGTGQRRTLIDASGHVVLGPQDNPVNYPPQDPKDTQHNLYVTGSVFVGTTNNRNNDIEVNGDGSFNGVVKTSSGARVGNVVASGLEVGDVAPSGVDNVQLTISGETVFGSASYYDWGSSYGSNRGQAHPYAVTTDYDNGSWYMMGAAVVPEMRQTRLFALGDTDSNGDPAQNDINSMQGIVFAVGQNYSGSSNTSINYYDVNNLGTGYAGVYTDGTFWAKKLHVDASDGTVHTMTSSNDATGVSSTASIGPGFFGCYAVDPIANKSTALTVSAENIDISGDLVVGGDCSFNSNAIIGGNLSAYNGINSDTYVIAQGEVLAKTKLVSEGDCSFNHDVAVGRNLNVHSDISANHSVTIGHNLNVYNDISADHNVTVGNKLIVHSDISANNNVTIGGNLSMPNTTSHLAVGTTAGGAVIKAYSYSSSQAGIDVSGTGYFRNQIHALQDISGETQLRIGGDATLKSDLITYGDCSFNSELNVGGICAFNGSHVAVGGNLYMSGSSSKMVIGASTVGPAILKVYSPSPSEAGIDVSGTGYFRSQIHGLQDISGEGQLKIGGDATLKSNLITYGDCSFNSDLHVGGEIYADSGVRSNTYVVAEGEVLATTKLVSKGDCSFNTYVVVGDYITIGENQGAGTSPASNHAATVEYVQTHVSGNTYWQTSGSNTLQPVSGYADISCGDIAMSNSSGSAILALTGSTTSVANTAVSQRFRSTTSGTTSTLAEIRVTGAANNVADSVMYVSVGGNDSIQLGPDQSTLFLDDDIELRGYTFIHNQSTTVNPGTSLFVNGDTVLYGDVDISNSGNLLVAGNVTAQAFNALSDASLKENVMTISGALESVGQLRGVQYNFISDASAVTHRGVIAQELEEVYPEMVGTVPGSEKKSVAYMELIGVLIEAVKELSGKVSTLETEVAALKSA